MPETDYRMRIEAGDDDATALTCGACGEQIRVKPSDGEDWMNGISDAACGCDGFPVGFSFGLIQVE